MPSQYNDLLTFISNMKELFLILSWAFPPTHHVYLRKSKMSDFWWGLIHWPVLDVTHLDHTHQATLLPSFFIYSYHQSFLHVLVHFSLYSIMLSFSVDISPFFILFFANSFRKWNTKSINFCPLLFFHICDAQISLSHSNRP